MTNLFVGNLCYQTTDSELATTFGEFGRLNGPASFEAATAASLEGSILEMSTAADGNRTKNALNREALNGRALNVNEAKPRERKAGQIDLRYPVTAARTERTAGNLSVNVLVGAPGTTPAYSVVPERTDAL